MRLRFGARFAAAELDPLLELAHARAGERPLQLEAVARNRGGRGVRVLEAPHPRAELVAPAPHLDDQHQGVPPAVGGAGGAALRRPVLVPVLLPALVPAPCP